MTVARTFRGFLQLFGGLAVGLAIFTGFMAWRLSTGPISLAFLSPYLETALRSEDGTFAIKLEDTILTWAGFDRTLEIRLRGAQAVGAAGAVVADVPELALSISGAALLRGKVAPRSLSIFGPSLVILRHKSGRFELGLPKSDKDASKVVAAMISDLFAPPGRSRSLSYLTRLNIVRGDLVIDDKQTDTLWQAPQANISFVRGVDGIRAHAELESVLEGEKATFTIDGDYNITEQRVALNIGFIDARPGIFARLSPKFAALKSIKLPLSGTLAVDMSLDGRVNTAAFNLSGGAGKIALPDPVEISVDVKSLKTRGAYSRETATVNFNQFDVVTAGDRTVVLPGADAHPMPLQEFSLAGSYFADFQRLDVSRFELDFGGPKAVGSMTAQQIGADLTIDVDGVVEALKIDGIGRYWPPALSPVVRRWIRTNVHAGVMPQVRSRLVGRWSPAQGLNINSLAGDLTFSDMVVDYLPPMSKLMKGRGVAKFDQKTLEITVAHGEAPGLVVRSGRVIFTDLDKLDQFADIELTIDGPLSAALQLIDRQPLKFAKAVGVRPESVAGDTSTQLKLNFLADRSLTAEKVKVAAVARLEDVRIPDVVRSLDLSDGQLKLVADNSGMNIQGRVKLGTISAALQWRENFKDSMAISTEYQLSGRLNQKQWMEELGLNFIPFTPEFTTGVMDTDLIVTRDQEGRGALTANLSLDGTAMKFPRLGWSKPVGARAVAEVEAHFTADRLIGIPRFSLAAQDLAILGTANFDDAGNARKIEFKEMRVAGTQLTGVAIPRKQGWDVDLRGPRLDLVTWLGREEAPEADQAEADIPLTLSLNVDRVQLYPESGLDRVTGALDFDGKIWRAAKLKADMGKPSANLVIELTPAGKGRKLKVRANDAGAVLRAFDLYDNMVGGQFEFDAEFDDTNPVRPLAGRARIRDFRVVNAPVLARLCR